MVILEAWAYGKPVLMTPECNLPEGFAADAAIRIETSVEGISRGLQDLFAASSSMLDALGCNGRNLVAKRFAWPRIAGEMKAVYDWVLGSGPRPACVEHA
jgi:poly(glycerol-phosphate) alpha-glucosyltransferase